MKFSLSWLKKFLNRDLKNSLICNQLTEIGLEVESLQKKKNFFKNSYIGKIISISNKSDKNILKIKFNKKFIINVLTKKKNFYIGMKLAVGLKNQDLIDFKNFVKINKKNNLLIWKIYTYYDFKIFGNKDYIVEFPKDQEIGILVEKYFNKFPDDLLTLNITPNRNDCLGIFGIARELSVINNFKLKNKFKHCNNLKKLKYNNDFKISISNHSICSSYFIKIIKNIDLSIQTPFWIRERLRKSHINSINIIYDVVNYVSLEYGQSIHIFDLDQFNKKKIKIRLSKSDESILLKKHSLVKIFKNTLVFENNGNIFSLGGYINSKNYLINENTKNIYIGSGVFKNSLINYIKKKYNKYYVSYDNYYRQCELNLCIFSLERISKILSKFFSGIHTSNICLINNRNIKKNIVLSYKKVNKVLGFVINKFMVLNILKKLEYIIFEKLYKLIVIPPNFRSDIIYPEDVISDLIRFYGYNKLPSLPLELNSYIPKKNFVLNKLFKIKKFLSHKGYSEVINYSFTDKNSQKLFFKNRKLIKIINPISKDLSYMRTSLFPGLLKNLNYNVNRQQENFRLFESGLCFIKNKNKTLKTNQNLLLSGIISGSKFQKNWFNKEIKFSFYDLKYDLEKFLLYFYNINNIYFKKSYINGFDANICAKIYFQNIKLGCIGLLSSSINKFFNIINNIFAFELFIEKIPILKKNPIQEFSFYPYSVRDISIIISNSISALDVIKECYKISLENIFKITIIDVYQGDKIPKNKKSLSLRIFFKNLKKNFTSNDIEILFRKCIHKIKVKFQAVLRDKKFL
ncbi:phenylalanine--tRNA ligase subunit beta [Buchnera aphidicola]|uniref:phenylalanine--tRNA ligase subunit beta n=1 Tax=Buchnera aphidicola TaxID=9 RepID=UPI0022379E1C|nr:phenylalanine--tRNA ligase subunit beta [Buchnera aphidicola]MCW5197632.1 phenylalanine--tRNA ligase subunit beta [Buchnera aphidicola (Chaitophorus viminalis)]